MLTIILGAGASYDSVVDKPPSAAAYENRPPLTRELFATRPAFGQVLDLYPMVQSIAHHFRTLPATAAFEAELDALQAESEGYPRLKQELAGLRFYLQRILWATGRSWSVNANGVTNFVGLLHRVDRWRYRRGERVCIINFDYDLLVDEAFAAIGVPMIEVADHVAIDEYKHIKPHGSVNWIRPVRSPHLGAGAGHGMILKLIEDIEKAEPSRPIVRIREIDEVSQQPCLPALMIPLQAKADFEMPPEHRQALRECLRVTDRMLVIGWRATEQHFLRLLAEIKPPVKFGHVVRGGRKGAEETAAVLQEVGIPPLGVSELGFSSFLASDELRGLLEA